VASPKVPLTVEDDNKSRSFSALLLNMIKYIFELEEPGWAGSYDAGAVRAKHGRGLGTENLANPRFKGVDRPRRTSLPESRILPEIGDVREYVRPP
jgi:hypothetical protein